MNIVKGLMNNNSHEVIELHGWGDKCIQRLTVVMRLLLNYKYCEIVRIKTGTEPAPVLKVSFKKSATFQASFDEYQQVMERRKQERETERKEKAAAKKSDSPQADQETAAV